MKECKNLTCIVCPLGCSLQVCTEEEIIESITGYSCKRGLAYAQGELTDPRRVLTTTVRVADGQFPLVPVKSQAPIPKGLVFDCMQAVNGAELKAPVRVGDVVIENILGTGVNIVATKNIEVGI